MSEARKIGLENKIGKERRKIKEKPGTKKSNRGKNGKETETPPADRLRPRLGLCHSFQKRGKGSKRRSRSQPTSKLKKKTSTNEDCQEDKAHIKGKHIKTKDLQ